ncbi:MAG: yliI 2 [Verrucomicrobiaceae bacterium]|nr:yliI 2 [Verrucomicrobiaceae bacterium]
MSLTRFVSVLLALPLIVSAEGVEWKTSRIHGSPEPPKPFIAEQVFANLPLTEILDMVPVPGLDQWVFVQNNGKLVVAPNDLAATKLDVALDLKALHPAVDHAYGIAFHPQFASNKQVFVTYTNGDKLDDGSRLSRFTVKQEKPLVIDPATEEVLVTWRSGGHNGAALTFGNDGLLYVSTGDSEVPAPPDPLKTGQDITDLLSSVLRLDVDHKADGKAYQVPVDNPFISMPKARPEIYAYGLRNPWKMSFDRPTGNLWCGDVGWEQWEQIFLIKKGGNYGWSAFEGNNSILPERLGPTPVSPPTVTHSHSEAASITGGFVYHGKRLPELEGAYIYGDYETGKIWALWHDGKQITRHEEIASTAVKIVTFGQGEDGDLYFVHWNKQSTVHRLVRNPSASKSADFPRKLSETGLFVDVVKQTPAAGVHDFAIRAPMWMDGAQGSRFIGVPAGKIETSLWKTKGKTDSKVIWPKDVVLAKTLTMQMAQGKAESVRKIETQVLHFDGLAWNAYSYRWNEAGTDADLVPAAGDERQLDLEGKQYAGGKHRYTYRFSNRAECLRCHNAWSGFALSFQPQQLSDADAILETELVDAKFFQRSAARLVNPYAHDKNGAKQLEAESRSWLHANCAHCHRENGGGSVPVILNAELALDEMRAVDAAPTRGDFGLKNVKVIKRGDPWNSVLLHRIATTGSGHMPAVGSREVDVAAAELLKDWIKSLAVPPEPGVVARAEVLSIGSSQLALLDVLEHSQSKTFGGALKEGMSSPNAHIRGLFERFLPDDQRVATLGTSVNVEKLLALKGEAARGAELFTPTGKASTCLACHFVNGTGRDFGPDLSKVGARLQLAQIAEAIISPSKTISQGFNALTVTLKDGSAQMGFVVKRDADQLTLKIATGQAVPIQMSQVKSEQTLPISLMPEGLLAGFTAQEAADLLAYLASLK